MSRSDWSECYPRRNHGHRREEPGSKVRFIAGFFVTFPFFLTGGLLWIFWSRIDDVFAPMYQKMLGRPIPGSGS